MKLVKKNAVFITVICVFAMQSVTAQSSYDSSYSTTYYGQKTTLFNLLPNTKNEIIFLGNSITDIGEWTEIWQDINVKNRGISGDNTFGVLARLPEIVAAKPKKIFIMIGINDIAKNIPDEVIIGNYKKIITSIEKATPATQIIVQSILPTNNTFTEFKNHQNKTEHILKINSFLKQFCQEKKIVFLNLYPKFLDATGKLDKQYTNDGLHINGYGYLLWKKAILEQGLMK